MCFQFQGGFVGKCGKIDLYDTSGQQIHTQMFYPSDINQFQKFNLLQTIENISKVKVTFNESTDFFGRIIIYKFDLNSNMYECVK